MQHQVSGTRQGNGAVLSCAICRQTATIAARDFESMNRFVEEHRLCLDASR